MRLRIPLRYLTINPDEFSVCSVPSVNLDIRISLWNMGRIGPAGVYTKRFAEGVTNRDRPGASVSEELTSADWIFSVRVCFGSNTNGPC